MSVYTFKTFINIFMLKKKNLTEAYKSIEIAMRCCSLVSHGFRRSRCDRTNDVFSLESFHRSRFLLAIAFYVSFLRNLFFVRKSQYLWYKMFSVHSTPEGILKRHNWICVCGKVNHRNHTIIVNTSFSKSSVFVYTKMKSWCFQIP